MAEEIGQGTASVTLKQSNLFAFIREQLSVDPMQSKKFIVAMTALVSMVACFIIAAILFFVRPDLAPHLVSITAILIPSIAGTAAVYLGAQGAVEVKANGVLQKQAQDLAGKLTTTNEGS